MTDFLGSQNSLKKTINFSCEFYKKNIYHYGQTVSETLPLPLDAVHKLRSHKIILKPLPSSRNTRSHVSKFSLPLPPRSHFCPIFGPPPWLCSLWTVSYLKINIFPFFSITKGTLFKSIGWKGKRFMEWCKK